jgi:hypothetical protein
MTDTGKCPAFGYDCEYVAKVEAQAAEIEIAQKVILEQLKARKEQAAEIERLREVLGKLAPMVDWMPHPDCVEAEQIIRAALGEAE